MKNYFAIALAFTLPLLSTAQDDEPQTSLAGGEGLKFVAKDNSASLKLGIRIQPLLAVNYEDYEVFTNPSMDEVQMSIRRARIKFDGFVYNPKWVYKFELAFGNRNIGGVDSHTGNGARIILDAVIKYEFAKNTYFWFGQTKLPGNRERVVSSQKLQFVDRSIANGRYNIDRDMGFQLHGKYQLAGKPVNLALAVSMGEGRNITDFNAGGLEYTARAEFLPFGKFKSKGDYSLSDLAREETHKLSIGATFDYNQNAVRQRGNQGTYMVNDMGEFYGQSLSAVFVDAIWKYNGWCALGEFFYKTAANPIMYDSTGMDVRAFYVGTGYNAQLGYVFKSNWEVAGRVSHVRPDAGVDLKLGNQTQYTAALSRYILGHSLKFQTDITYSVYELVPSADDNWQFRFQMEIAL